MRALARAMAVSQLAAVLLAGLASCGGTSRPSEPSPDSAAGKLEQAQKALLVGQNDRALELSREVLAMEPDSARAHIVMGLALRFARQVKGDPVPGPEELQALDKAVALAPKSTAAAANLIAGLRSAGQEERASRMQARLTALSPSAPWTKELIAKPRELVPKTLDSLDAPLEPAPGVREKNPQEP